MIQLKSVRYKNMDLENKNKEINSNKNAQREVADVEFAEEATVEQTINEQNKDRIDLNPQKKK